MPGERTVRPGPGASAARPTRRGERTGRSGLLSWSPAARPYPAHPLHLSSGAGERSSALKQTKLRAAGPEWRRQAGSLPLPALHQGGPGRRVRWQASASGRGPGDWRQQLSVKRRSPCQIDGHCDTCPPGPGSRGRRNFRPCRSSFGTPQWPGLSYSPRGKWRPAAPGKWSDCSSPRRYMLRWRAK